MQKVILPEGLLLIGEQAFQACSQLTEVVFSGTEQEIGAYAFAECVDLPTVRLPAWLTRIGEYAFYSCTGLTGDLIIPEGGPLDRSVCFRVLPKARVSDSAHIHGCSRGICVL